MKLFIVILLTNIVLLAKTITFGIVPQQSPQKIYEAWQPFISYLSKYTKTEIRLRTEKSIPEFEKKLYSGQYDIAYSNPYHFVIANKKQNHQAVARFDKDIIGILVTKKDSKINSIKDIKDKSFIFPAPKAFAATILTKYETLENINHDIEKSKKFRYVNSHDSVYKGIQRNIAQVGGGIIRTFNKFKDKDDLKIIYKTNKYPSHPISVANNLDEKFKEKLLDALISIPKDVINPINTKSLKLIDTKEYDIVKKLANKLNILE
jgi:phosphonate transport system substrate-binding protein